MEKSELATVAAYWSRYAAKAILTLEAVLDELGATECCVRGSSLYFKYNNLGNNIDLNSFISAVMTINSGTLADPLIADFETAHDKTLRVIERLLVGLS